MTDNTQSIFEQQMSHEIWDTNYRAPEEADVQATWRRQAVACASIEKEEIREEVTEDFYWLLRGFKSAGGGRITANLGVADRAATTLMNCFVFDASPTISPKGVDSIEGIYKLLEKQAQTLKSEGGYGHNFSWVRPEGTYIEGIGSRTPGVVSFMGLWNESSKIITQGSEKVVGELRKEEKKKIRKGAMMGVLDVSHPDIFRFIDAKLQEGVLDKFNLSVGIIDGFMEALDADSDWDLRFPDTNFDKYDSEWDGDIELWESKGYPVHIYETVKAKTLWDYIMNSTFTRNDPGVLYTGLANKLNPLWYCEVIRASNPCGEIMMPTGVCNLMSINLPRFYSKDSGFNWQEFGRAIKIAVRFSDNINDISPVPLDEYKQSMIDKRRIGVGTLGIGSLLFMMGIPFNSEEGLAFQDKFAKFKCETELLASARLGEEKGSFRLFDAEKYFTESYYWKNLPISDEVKAEIEAIGCMRNSHQSANAPTGNMSIYLGMVSGGIEPVFATEYNRFAIVVESERAKLRKEGLKFPDVFKGEWFETDIFKENNRGNDSVLRGTWKDTNYEIDNNRGITKENRVMDYGYKWCEENLTDEEFARYESDGVFSTAQNMSADDHLNSLAIFAKYTNQNNSKCVKKGTLVQTNKGLMKIEDFGSAGPKNGIDKFGIVGDGIKVKDENGKWQNVIGHYYGGEKATAKITFDDGTEIESTLTHKFKTTDGWVPAGELNSNHIILKRVSDYNVDSELIPVGDLDFTNSIKHTTPKYFDEDFALFLGMYVSDGSIAKSNYTIILTTNDNDVEEVYISLVNKLFDINPKIVYDKRTKDTRNIVFSSKPISQLIGSLSGYGSVNKKAPKQILQSSRNIMTSFMSGVTLDGYVIKSNGKLRLVNYHGYSKELRNQLASMGELLGYTVRKIEKSVVGGTCDKSYGVEMSGIDFSPIESHKKYDFTSRVDRYYPSSSIMYNDIDERTITETSKSTYNRLADNTRTKIRVLENFGWKYEKGLIALKVKKIELGRQDEVYDIEVENTHSYLIDGVITHNTINLPNDYPFNDFQDIYKRAHDMGIKGTTTYRDGTMSAVLENIKDDQEDLEDVFATDDVIHDNVKLPSEYISNGYVIRDNNKKKWYVNIAFTDLKKTKPFAIFVHTNSSEGSEVTNETIEQLIYLAVEKGIKSELVAVHEYKLKKVSNVVKIARTIGLLLRHNISIIDIVDVLDEGEYPLASFTFHIKRLLKQFIKDGEKVTGDRGVCPECGGQIIYQEGCIMCMQCGWSKCG